MSLTEPDNYISRSEEHRLNSSHEWISYAVFCLKKKQIPCRATPAPDTTAPPQYRLTHDRRARGDVDLPLVSDCSVLPRVFPVLVLFSLTDPPTTEIYTLSLHAALPI